MSTRLRDLLVPIVVVSLAVGGLAFGAVDDDSTLDGVQNTAEEAPEIVLDDGLVEDDEPTEVPESDDTPTPIEGTEDDGIVDEAVEEAIPDDGAGESHGPQWSSEGCPEGFSGNHGQYVSGSEERPRHEAAKSQCGKPVHEKEEADEPPAEEDDGAAASEPTPGS